MFMHILILLDIGQYIVDLHEKLKKHAMKSFFNLFFYSFTRNNIGRA